MRQGRLKVPQSKPFAYYHCFNHLLMQNAPLDALDKECFIAAMRRAETLCQVHVLTFCILDNHFHILLEVPCTPSPLPDWKSLLQLLSPLLSPQAWLRLQSRFESLASDPARAQELATALEPYYRRMWDVSQFMKTLKEHFTQDYNRRHHLRGTLWDDRFKSLVVEGRAQSLDSVAAYIDLNPLRARMVPEANPLAYRWSGLAMAMRGDSLSRRGILRMMGWDPATGTPAQAAEALARYREFVYRMGAAQLEAVDEAGRPVRGVVNPEVLRQVIQNRGRVTLGEYLRYRVGYFMEGVVLGSQEFVEEMFHHHRHRFGKRRKEAALRLEGLEEELYSLRAYSPDLFG